MVCFFFFSSRRSDSSGGWQESSCGGPVGVGAGRGRAAAICPLLLGISSFPLCPGRGRGGSEPPSSALGRGVSPQGQAGSWGNPHQPWGVRTAVPKLAGRSTGVTLSASAGSRGAPGGRNWALGGAGESFGGSQLPQDPRWVQTLLRPPRHARKNPKCSSGFLPGLGGAAGARLCQGLVISSEDVSELLGLAAEITEPFQLPIPPCLAFGKFPFSSLESPWVVGGVGEM